jgi:hypothetical protein
MRSLWRRPGARHDRPTAAAPATPADQCPGLPDELDEAGKSGTRQPTVAGTMDELPEQRRETMLWRRALTHSYEDVEDLLRLPDHRRPCTEGHRPRPGNWTGARAVRGDDGLFHLRLGERMACGVLHTHAGRARVLHVQRLFLHPDGRTRGYFPDPHDPIRPNTAGHLAVADGLEIRDRRWEAVLGDDAVADLAAIPRAERCPARLDFGQWPTPITPGTAKGQLRRRLVDTLGPLCAGCHDAWGNYIDHDHFTGLVRGLLCQPCNSSIDGCPHLSGCPWADYLDNPPAAHLQLLHPDRAQDRRRDARKIAFTGLDPYTA